METIRKPVGRDNSLDCVRMCEYASYDNKKMIIGIGGRKRTGKTTCAKYLLQTIENSEEYAFAGPLKLGCATFFDFNTAQIHGDAKDVKDERWGITPRKVYEIFGTDIFRHFLREAYPEFKQIGDQFWIERFKLWQKTKPAGTTIVISDVRYTNEVKSIQECGGIVVKLVRQTGYISKHESDEVDIPYDFLIDNNGTKHELCEQIKNIINSFGTQKK